MNSIFPAYCCEAGILKLNWPFGSSIGPKLGSAVIVLGLVSVNGPIGPMLGLLRLPYMLAAFIVSQFPLPGAHDALSVELPNSGHCDHSLAYGTCAN